MRLVPAQTPREPAWRTVILLQLHTLDKVRRRLHRSTLQRVVLALFVATLLFGSFVFSDTRPGTPAIHAAAAGCSEYRIRYGDTLNAIAWRYHTTIWTLARANGIRNVNLIYAGAWMCIPSGSGRVNTGGGGSGARFNGIVRWYDYGALQWSSRAQVRSILYAAAASNGLPARLLLAIAWQESNWTQHVISWDGGIGVMQVMPYTAMDINAGSGIRRDPYLVGDNIYMGATYLRWLWNSFHGNLARTISAYNEGGWAVMHRGIFNWGYVNNVLYLMRVLS